MVGLFVNTCARISRNVLNMKTNYASKPARKNSQRVRMHLRRSEVKRSVQKNEYLSASSRKMAWDFGLWVPKT